MRKRNFRRLQLALAHLPYRPALKILRTLSGNAAARQLLFPRTTKAVDDIYRNACGIPCDDRTVQLIIMSKALARLQARKVEEFSDREFARYVRVNGLDIVQDLCASGRGLVIAAAHYTSARALRPILVRHGVRAYYLARSGPGRNPDERVITTYDKAPFFGVKEVQAILKTGGQVTILFDGRQGKTNIAHPFLGRDSYFKGGMFDVAQRVGAAIVPTVVDMDIDGRISVEFYPPLRADDPDGPHDSPVANLVHGYVSVLEGAIRARPWCFDPLRVELFWGGGSVE